MVRLKSWTLSLILASEMKWIYFLDAMCKHEYEPGEQDMAQEPLL